MMSFNRLIRLTVNRLAERLLFDLMIISLDPGSSRRCTFPLRISRLGSWRLNGTAGVTNRIMDAVDQLKSFAEMGTLLSSIADVSSEYRYLVSGNYMVFYRIQGSDVYIDRVLYGRSNYINILFNDLLREDTAE